MSGIIGKKLGMTSLFDSKGKSVGCTVIEAGPCFVTQIKDRDKDGSWRFSSEDGGFGVPILSEEEIYQVCINKVVQQSIRSGKRLKATISIGLVCG